MVLGECLTKTHGLWNMKYEADVSSVSPSSFGSLMTTILPSTCFAASFWLPHKVFGIRFRITGQSYISPTQLTASISSRPAKTERKKPPPSPLKDDFGSWTLRSGHFQIVHLPRLHWALFWNLDSFLFLAKPGSFVHVGSKYLSWFGELVFLKNRLLFSCKWR